MPDARGKHGVCCQDYQKSKWLKCESCEQMAQVIPTLGLCQTCTLGEFNDPTEVWRVHSLNCYKIRRRQDEAPRGRRNHRPTNRRS